MRAEIIPVVPDTDNAETGKHNQQTAPFLFINFKSLDMKRIFFVLSFLVQCVVISTEAYGKSEPIDSLPTYRVPEVKVIGKLAYQSEASSNISRRTISQSNYGLDITSALALTPSVIATNETGIGIGNTAIRLRGANSAQLNVTINGVKLNNPDTHAVYWYDTPDIASSVEFLAVQRGSGSEEQNIGTFGGAINMFTGHISDRLNGSASLSYGSYNTNKQAVQISSGLMGGHWAVDARVTHIGSDGYIDRGATDLKSYMVQGAYSGRNTQLKLVSFGGKAKTYLTYNGATKEEMARNGRRYNSSGMYQTSDAYSHRIWNSEDEEWQQVNYYSDQTDNYLQINNQLYLRQRLHENWWINATAFYTYGYGYYKQYKESAKLYEYSFPQQEAYELDAKGEFVLDDDGEKIALRRDLIREKIMRNHYGGVNWATEYYARIGLKATLGGSWSYYKCPHWGELDWIQPIAPASFKAGQQWYDNNVTKQEATLFARFAMPLAKGLELNADLQYRYVGYNTWGTNDNYDGSIGAMQPIDVDVKYHFFNPRASITYRLSPHHKFYFTFALAHKEPTRNDFTDRYRFSDSNEEPSSERLFDYEFGYTYSVPKFITTINFYYMKYKDQLVHTGLVNDSADALNVNVPDSYRRGVELTAAWNITSWLTASANATFSQNKIEHYVDALKESPTFGKDLGDRTISYSPSAMGAVALALHRADFDATLQTQVVGQQYLTNDENATLSLGRYCVTNLNLGYTLRWAENRNVRFGVAIYNLFNADYCSNGYGYSYMDTWSGDQPKRVDRAYYFAQAPLNVLANVTVKF